MPSALRRDVTSSTCFWTELRGRGCVRTSTVGRHRCAHGGRGRDEDRAWPWGCVELGPGCRDLPSPAGLSSGHRAKQGSSGPPGTYLESIGDRVVLEAIDESGDKGGIQATACFQ